MTEPTPGDRYADIFRRAHAHHPACLEDPWLARPCRRADGTEDERSLVWSRRNGPWTHHETLWVGAAPGNAGGMGSGRMGAHATRIPFGGDIAGANLDVLLSSVGLNRNQTFIVAALNQLPERGGGEPRVAEMRAPVGAIPTSAHLLRETILAAAPRLIVALGNVALRTTVAATRIDGRPRLTLPGLERLKSAGLARGHARSWPDAFAPDETFRREWSVVREGAPLPDLLWLLHPSAQNMSPFAGPETVFHQRMVDTVAELRRAVGQLPGWRLPRRRPDPPREGIYALPDWREAVGPRHAELDARWRAKGV